MTQKEALDELERQIEIYRSNNIQDNYSEIILELNGMLQSNMGLYLPCKESGDGYDLKTLTGDDGKKYMIACTNEKDHREKDVKFVFLTLKEIMEYIMETPICSGMCLNQIESGNQVIINRDYAYKLLMSLKRSKEEKE